MEINLGQIVLTKNQVQYLYELQTENIKGFSYWTDTQTIIVVVIRDLSSAEKAALIAEIRALPDVLIPHKTEKERLLEVLGLKEEDITTLKAVTAEKAIK